MSVFRGFVANKFAMVRSPSLNYSGLYANRFGFAKALDA
jgi:hypothetical protein